MELGMDVTVFPNARATQGELKHTSLADIARMKHIETGDKLNAHLIFYGKLEGDSRKTPMSIVYRNGVQLDIDKCSWDCLEALKEALKGLRYTIYSTYSHDPANNIYSYRVIIETSEKIEPQDFRSVYTNFINSRPKLKKLSDDGVLDKSAGDETRSFFAPSCKKDKEVVKYTTGGLPLIPDTRKSMMDILSVVPKGLDDNMKALVNTGNYKQSSFKKVVESQGCKQIQYIIDNAKHLEEPMWYAGLSIAQHCEDRNIAIHEISKDYPNYTPQETENKANQTQDKPQSCNTFNKLNPGVCDSCINRGKFTNPLALGKQDPTSEIPKQVFMNYDELMDSPEMEWLVDELIVKGSVNMIFGKSGDTKSFCALHLASCISHKRAFFGQETNEVEHHIPIIYDALEGVYGMKNRVRGYHQYYGLDKPKDFYTTSFNPVLTQDVTVDTFIAEVKKLDVKEPVIIIDTYNQATPAMNENDAGQTGQVMKNCQKMVQELGATIIIIHHSNRGEDADYRGSSALHGAMDTMLKIKRTSKITDEKQYFQLEVYKIKDGEVGRQWSYTTNQETLGYNKKGKPITTLVISELGVTKPKGAKQKLGKIQKFVYQLAKERLKSYVDGDLYSEVRESITKKLITIDTNKRNYTFNKLMTELVGYGLFYTWTDANGNEKIKLQNP